MAVQIIDTLKPKNEGSFPVAMANDIELSTGERLEDYLKKTTENPVPLKAENARAVESSSSDTMEKEIIKTSPVFFATKKKINENPNSEIDFHLTRIDNIVYVSVYTMLEQITNSTKVRTKIPEGYRPNRTVIFELYPLDEVPMTRSLMKIETDGDVFVYHEPVELSDVKLEKRTAVCSYITLDIIGDE